MQRYAKTPKCRFVAEIILSHVLDVDRSYCYCHSDKEIDAKKILQLDGMMQRYEQGEPLGYILGKQEFCDLQLTLTKDTLIPRPETECLVYLTLDLFPESSEISVLDLGTGSGAIALALAKARPHWHVTACDISQAALDVAKSNAEKNCIANLNFIYSDLFNALDGRRYDVIVSNPPYIAEGDPHLDSLSYEPINALVAGQDGLDVLEKIIAQAHQYLYPNGLLMVEHGYDQKTACQHLMKAANFTDVETFNDLSGHDRITKGIAL